MSRVHTFNLMMQREGRKKITCAVGSVTDLAEHAALELHRMDESISDAELDRVESNLRRKRRVVCASITFEIVPAVEEYEGDDDEDVVDVCITGNSAVNGCCGDPDCPCSPSE